jgi:mRNA-degrading endonuclease toxin of MazEF toxin-antitoxin module
VIGNQPDKFRRGTVIQARLPKRGHEEGGDRPAVVMSAEAMTVGSTIIIIPCTMTLPDRERPYLVVLDPDETGLPYTSVALINHIRVLDKAFILDRQRGLLIPTAMARVDRALSAVLDLNAA